ncbi:LeuA family protein [Micromonospora echinofusca]|uniref:2-isopropylmalate synthase n=1 Tax=Micromonospora echinofusca TaxID=47858 RepID=A0ABS3VUK6_MICEH|nr:pyruvate carboxyltransferase [Micromonospora echinofusca]MBO4208053.1 pyruvate carboxyltransferase [Micromonospora echinofusca]
MTVEQGPQPRRVSVFDSTLRDGEQAPGNAMTPEQKLEIALALEAVGVDVIETGFPSSSPSDFKATRLIAESLTTARFATLNRADPADISLAAEAGGVGPNHQLQLMATGSDIHLEHKRGLTRAQGIQEIVDSFRFARSLGFATVSLAIEDASRGGEAYLRPLIEAGVAEGADTVVVADTTGCLIPAEYADLIARVRSWIPDDVVLSCHCHHDMGLSLANALAGIAAGADEVQVTLAGIGERSGNTPLEELAVVLAYKGEQLGVTSTVHTDRLYPAYQLLCGFIGLTPPRNKAIFGDNAFATQAGIHQAGMLRAPITYEYVEPHRFGRERLLLVGRHSGRNVVRHVIEQAGVPVDEALVEHLYEDYVANRTNGECVSTDDLRQLVLAKVAGHPTGPTSGPAVAR